MKKITYAQACKRLEKGKTIKCRVSSREIIIIKTKADLDAKKNLYEQGVQGFELYENKQIVRIPKGAKSITMDEAAKEIAEGKAVYFKAEKHEEKLVSIPELTNRCRFMIIRGEEPVIYKYVD